MNAFLSCIELLFLLMVAGILIGCGIAALNCRKDAKSAADEYDDAMRKQRTEADRIAKRDLTKRMVYLGSVK